MEYNTIKRKKLFKNEYTYKVHFHANVSWDGTKEIWHNEDDKKYMAEIREFFNHRNPGKSLLQGAVMYFKELDDTYWCRMYYDEKIMKIEKSIK